MNPTKINKVVIYRDNSRAQKKGGIFQITKVEGSLEEKQKVLEELNEEHKTEYFISCRISSNLNDPILQRKPGYLEQKSIDEAQYFVHEKNTYRVLTNLEQALITSNEDKDNTMFCNWLQHHKNAGRFAMANHRARVRYNKLVNLYKKIFTFELKNEKITIESFLGKTINKEKGIEPKGKIYNSYYLLKLNANVPLKMHEVFEVLQVYNSVKEVCNFYLKPNITSDEFKNETNLKNGIYKTRDGKYFQKLDKEIKEITLKDSSRDMTVYKDSQELQNDLCATLFEGYISQADDRINGTIPILIELKVAGINYKFMLSRYGEDDIKDSQADYNTWNNQILVSVLQDKSLYKGHSYNNIIANLNIPKTPPPIINLRDDKTIKAEEVKALESVLIAYYNETISSNKDFCYKSCGFLEKFFPRVIIKYGSMNCYCLLVINKQDKAFSVHNLKDIQGWKKEVKNPIQIKIRNKMENYIFKGDLSKLFENYEVCDEIETSPPPIINLRDGKTIEADKDALETILMGYYRKSTGNSIFNYKENNCEFLKKFPSRVIIRYGGMNCYCLLVINKQNETASFHNLKDIQKWKKELHSVMQKSSTPEQTRIINKMEKHLYDVDLSEIFENYEIYTNVETFGLTYQDEGNQVEVKNELRYKLDRLNKNSEQLATEMINFLNRPASDQHNNDYKILGKGDQKNINAEIEFLVATQTVECAFGKDYNVGRVPGMNKHARGLLRRIASANLESHSFESQFSDVIYPPVGKRGANKAKNHLWRLDIKNPHLSDDSSDDEQDAASNNNIDDQLNQSNMSIADDLEFSKEADNSRKRNFEGKNDEVLLNKKQKK